MRTCTTKTERLYYRDDKYIGKSTPKGAKVFWSRGNGWVMAGLAKVLQSMPEEYGNREFYTTLFQEMAYRIKELQLQEGYWPTSLLDSSHFGGRESSGPPSSAMRCATESMRVCFLRRISGKRCSRRGSFCARTWMKTDVWGMSNWSENRPRMSRKTTPNPYGQGLF